MSVHDFALLAPSPHHTDPFASAFLSPYHPPPQYPQQHHHHHHHHPLHYYPQQQSFLPRALPPPPPPPPTHLRGFDPRPPHAGWTPKEEIDDDESRDLLAPRSAHHPTPPSPIDHTLADDAHSPSATSSASKTYSFVSLPGNAVRKRPRRRYDEIERLYACAWPDCTKAYGTLNHLNAHVSMQRHGPKRSPAEFKELRKQWRQQKKHEVGGSSSSSSSTGASTSTPDQTAPTAQPTEHPHHHHHHHLHQRRRRDTVSTLPAMHPRLSLGDLRFPPHSDTEGPSPTSSASDSATFWQDSPVSPPLSRLPPDSTLLAPYPARAPSPHAVLPPYDAYRS